jgi:hypothetical protein
MRISLMRPLLAATLLVAALAASAKTAPEASHPGAGKRVFYVTRLDEVPGASDRHRQIQQAGLAADRIVARHLEDLGFRVTFEDQTVDPNKATGFDLVVLSSVVQSREMADTGFKDVPVPLLTTTARSRRSTTSASSTRRIRWPGAWRRARPTSIRTT